MSKKKTRAKGGSRLLGVAGSDGHTRITNGPGYTLSGGDKETHERMQTTAEKFNEQLQKKGKRLEDIGPSEFRDMIGDAQR